MGQEGPSGSGSFWSSLPGVLTGLAALITAGAGVYALTRDNAEAGPARPEAALNAQAPAPAAAEPPKALAGSGRVSAKEMVPESDPPAAAAVEPGTCIAGYVWREARPGDRVCVTPATRDETAAENDTAASRRSPTGGPYGENTCLSGYVWRDAYEGDAVCVEPAVRDRARADNRAANERVVR